MHFLEEIAEQRIAVSIEAGELDDLPDAGRAFPNEEGLEGIAPEFGMARRIMKIAGYVPEELRLHREITALLKPCRPYPKELREMKLQPKQLMLRFGECQSGNQVIQDDDYAKVANQLASVNQRDR